MTGSSETPIAEYRDCRRGVDDVTTLFADRIEVRWKRSTESGETSIPLFVLSPHFDRRRGTGGDYHRLVWPGACFVVLAIVGAIMLPLPYSDYVGLGGAVGAAFCFGFVVFSSQSTETRWSFMDMMHTTTLLTLNACPQYVAAAEAFVAAFVMQVNLGRSRHCAFGEPSDSDPSA